MFVKDALSCWVEGDLGEKVEAETPVMSSDERRWQLGPYIVGAVAGDTSGLCHS